jgi:hypothetical protein
MKTTGLNTWTCAWAALPIILVAHLSQAQPKPGDVFREFTYNYGKTKSTHFSELDPDCPRKADPTFEMRKMKHKVPKGIMLDLEQAVRAELTVEYWGGHIGTSNQRFAVNSNEWIDLPQPSGTPGNPVCYHRTVLGNNAVPIPLNQLRHGTNIVQFLAGPQIKHGFKWGFYWIYDFTIRVYYEPTKPHATGQIAIPAAGATLGDLPTITAKTTAAADGLRVDFIGLYEDFDWAGNGRFHQWQYYTEHGVKKQHLGTATNAPYQVIWKNEWVPDQDKIALAAIITDAQGISYFTPPVENIQLHRTNRSVKMYRAHDVPEKMGVRAGNKAGCKIALADDLARARSARLVLSTWSASTDDESVHELCLNGQRLGNRFGAFHNYSHDQLAVPLPLLKQGDNAITIFSEFKGHGFEINWPGPVLMIEYNR